MATSYEAATAAARVLKVGGEEYFITPLDDKGWAEYFAWCKDEFIDTVKRNVGDLEPEDRQKILSEMFERVGKLTMDSPEIVAIADSVGGRYRLLRMHLLPRQPDMTSEDVARVFNSETLRELALQRIEETLAVVSSKKKAQPKKRRKR